MEILMTVSKIASICTM
uniref:Uncharacterized protein n=2 Tax=Sauria TaxID=32561 RepID=A0A8D0GJB5_SPHPU